MDYLGEIAKGGFGYLLFAGSLLVLYHKDKQVQVEREKRTDDLLTAREAYTTTLKDLVYSVNNLKESVDSLAEGIRWKGNNK